MSREIQTIVIVACLILVFGIGFVVGYLVKPSETGLHDQLTTSGSSNEVVPLSDAGKRVATGLMPACGAKEPLIIHNCPTANEMKRTIESLLKSGVSEKEARETVIGMYGQRIVMGGQTNQ